jgi:hypothetical protein
MTSSSNETLERIARRIPIPEPAYERVLHRRDRKRRNQRIAAGVVGIAFFVAAVGLVTTFGSSDHTQPGASGGAATGPTVTEPTETGTAETGPVVSAPYDYDPNADYVGLPPEGSEPTSPKEVELVAEEHVIHVGRVTVFADGRVISWSEGLPGSPATMGYREQLLTPEGVELVRSGALDPVVLLDAGPKPFASPVPARAWEDSTLRLYTPYRYAICLEDVALFPAAAKDVLRGKQRVGGCFDVTTEEARTIEEILLSDERFEIGGDAAYGRYEIWTTEMVDDENPDHHGNPALQADFHPILPHGTFASQGG